MTPEENFIAKLEAFFDDPIVFTDVVKRRVEYYLNEYKKEIPEKIVYKQVIKEVIKVVSLYADAPVHHVEQQSVKDTLRIKLPLVTEKMLTQHARSICKEYGVDFNVFMTPVNGKSTVQLTNVRKVFCQYIMQNYLCSQNTLKKFFDVNHTSIVYYLKP